MTHSDSSTRLIIAAVLGVAVIIVLIVWSRMHPFLALTLGSAVLAVAAGIPLTDTFKAFTRGLGSTIGNDGRATCLGYHLCNHTLQIIAVMNKCFSIERKH